MMEKHGKPGLRISMGLNTNFPRGVDCSLAMSMQFFMPSQSKSSRAWTMALDFLSQPLILGKLFFFFLKKKKKKTSHFSVASQEQSAKFTADELGLKSFLPLDFILWFTWADSLMNVFLDIYNFIFIFGSPSQWTRRRIFCIKIRVNLSKITSRIMIMEKPGSNNKTKIGFSMKFEAKEHKVLGYSQKTEIWWDYSFDSIKSIKDSLTLPKKNLFNCLQLTCRKSDLLHSNCAECTVTVPKHLHMQTDGVWMLRKLFFQCKPSPSSKKKQKISKGSWMCINVLRNLGEQNSVDAICFPTQPCNKNGGAEGMDQFKRHSTIQDDHQNVLGKANTNKGERKLFEMCPLGDPVTMVSDCRTLPMAMGIVLGITDNLLEIVFDKKFIGGKSLML
ncbi:hypothetical protein VP01_399g6 [Puccinia sorghi]|uniref:Uncharacterized protein n=1 Tax=Puccinia sorghi TaxID=27349 RepID=A0A0L6US63_9BASI|nr:hypothetical protein VP01_399g6 [Puccinia sorghi]